MGWNGQAVNRRPMFIFDTQNFASTSQSSMVVSSRNLLTETQKGVCWDAEVRVARRLQSQDGLHKHLENQAAGTRKKLDEKFAEAELQRHG